MKDNVMVMILIIIVAIYCLVRIQNIISKRQKKILENYTAVEEDDEWKSPHSKKTSDFSISGVKFSYQKDLSKPSHLPIGAIVNLQVSTHATDNFTQTENIVPLKSTVTYTPEDVLSYVQYQTRKRRQPLGSIIASIVPLSKTDYDAFDHCGHILMPLGGCIDITLPTSYQKQIRTAYNLKDSNPIVAPTMRNRTLNFDTNFSYQGGNNHKHGTTASEKDFVKKLEKSKADTNTIAAVVMHQGSQKEDALCNKQINEINDFSNAIQIDLRDKGNVVYYYMVIGYTQTATL